MQFSQKRSVCVDWLLTTKWLYYKQCAAETVILRCMRLRVIVQCVKCDDKVWMQDISCTAQGGYDLNQMI